MKNVDKAAIEPWDKTITNDYRYWQIYSVHSGGFLFARLTSVTRNEDWRVKKYIEAYCDLFRFLSSWRQEKRMLV